ncbi:hypothetical protein AS850_07045 [Frondihabitans sp. 762G35]|uniref:CpsD/CapB family tyrosine-protein kinase n=1 Tax=Frondihabitans sp. 762G35 TaxID=1446794 RepID=UPI000D21E5AC|nr:CpsD/CapB family tyrosine-protein kinase [Frondihabitans sp. 762G35]ARC56831.1 hypothetical protein AS850_07045 [Frondihabitans sp. 762G35]
MTGPARDRSGIFDVAAQLRRRWAVLAGSALIGLVVGVAALQVVPRGTAPVDAPNAVVAVVLLVFVALGIAGGAVVGLVLVHLHPRVTTVDDVRRVTGLPVVALLPAATIDPDDVDDSAFGQRGSSRRMRTSLREGLLNTRALFGGALPERIVIARTDSVAETSGVDAGLARALVESGYVPALVRTDFESRMLAGESPLVEEPLGQTTRPDSHGYERLGVSDRVSSARPADRLHEVDRFLGALGERYDVTVSQAASNSLPVPLRSIAPAASAVLLVVRSNRTTVESLVSLYAELIALDVEPLGVVMTAVAPRHRVLLRRTWMPTDFRDASAGSRVETSFRAASSAPAPVPAPVRSGFSIADLARPLDDRKDPS